MITFLSSSGAYDHFKHFCAIEKYVFARPITWCCTPFWVLRIQLVFSYGNSIINNWPMMSRQIRDECLPENCTLLCVAISLKREVGCAYLHISALTF